MIENKNMRSDLAIHRAETHGELLWVDCCECGDVIGILAAGVGLHLARGIQ